MITCMFVCTCVCIYLYLGKINVTVVENIPYFGRESISWTFLLNEFLILKRMTHICLNTSVKQNVQGKN